MIRDTRLRDRDGDEQDGQVPGDFSSYDGAVDDSGATVDEVTATFSTSGPPLVLTDPDPDPPAIEGPTADGPSPGAAADRLTRRLAGEPPTEAAQRRLADAAALLRLDQPTTRRRWWRRRRAREVAEVHTDARRLIGRITRPVEGARTIAVASTKGGVGKTTMALMLGQTLASLRDDRVVALDANPDAGSLGHRIERETAATALDLLDLVGQQRDYYDLRHFTTQTPSRLEVIAAPEDPRDTRGIGQSDMEEVLSRLRTHYTLVLTDCGTGVDRGVNRAILGRTDQLVIVAAARVDAVHSVTYLLRWLVGAGLGGLVEGAVLVLNAVHPSGGVDPDAVAAHFAPLVRTVVPVPWDPVLARGGVVELAMLDPATRHALAGLAAEVADGL